MIMQLINYFIGSFFISVATYYVATKIMNKKFDLFKYYVFSWILFETITLSFLYFWVPNNILRLIINLLILIYICSKWFKISLLKNLILSFSIFCIMLLSEVLFVMLNVLFYGIDIAYIHDYFFMTILSNFQISIYMSGLINFKRINLIFRNLLDEIEIKNSLYVDILLFSSIFCLIFLLYYIFFDVNLVLNLISTFCLIICYIVFLIVLLKEKNYNFKLKLEYEVILKNIESYENDLVEQRMKNHENRNLLISIKGMIDKKDTKTREFINKVLNVSNNEDRDILFITRDIPLGGLQGLIYQKILTMKSKNIRYFVNVDKSIKKNIFKDLTTNTIKDICVSVGVFLDNAIQELDMNKEKMIGIQIYSCYNNNIVIEISNNYSGVLNISLFDIKGFSTKGKNHGYGLNLVKEIINNNNHLDNIREINGNIFIQKLIIKK